MSITRQAVRESANETPTQQANRSASATTPSATLYPARSRGSISGEYAIGKNLPRAYVEDSTWGWANRMTWDPEFGFRVDGFPYQSEPEESWEEE